MNIDIIGGGIGGLTMAIALQQKGINYRIFEQADEIKSVGAGIILANNAMQVYKKLGLKQKIEQKGNLISTLKIVDLNFKPLSIIKLRSFENKHGVKNVAIHREDLQQILLSEIKSENLYLNHRLTSIENTHPPFKLEFGNKKSALSHTLIGADGLKSQVRNLIFNKGEIRDAHQICWRGVVEYQLPKKFQNEVNELWGKGDRFGFVSLDTQRVYWYALKSINKKNQYTTSTIESYFENYPTMIRELLAFTPKNTIHCDRIADLKSIDNWYRGNICLLGDAAHATTPNLGQGACQAIEDAYTLAHSLATQSEVSKAFFAYQNKRIKKAQYVVKTSWIVGKIAHWENAFAIELRNFLLRNTPQSVNQKQSERIFEL